MTRDELEHLEVYTNVGKLEEAVERFEEEADECDENEAAAFSALVWLGRLLKAILGKQV
ncbi:MAG: hypothetical protein K2Q26_12530 [Bdellovibrionales bacterium]|nr:hypothetical protein [Bdellovibrionales bacterium]